MLNKNQYHCDFVLVYFCQVVLKLTQMSWEECEALWYGTTVPADAVPAHTERSLLHPASWAAHVPPRPRHQRDLFSWPLSQGVEPVSHLFSSAALWLLSMLCRGLPFIMFISKGLNNCCKKGTRTEIFLKVRPQSNVLVACKLKQLNRVWNYCRVWPLSNRLYP